MTNFSGSNIAIITPFTEDGGAVNFDVLSELIEWQINEGTDGIITAGTTGEAATMSHAEQEQLIRYVVEKVAGRCKVIAGAGSNNTAEALNLTRFAKSVGADAVLSVTPYYNKPTPDGLVLHYKKLSDEVAIPIMLYNVPGRTGMKMSAATIARLKREVPNVAAVKEACGCADQVSQIREISDIEILSGDDMLTLPMIALGASGVVSVVANIVPRLCKNLCVAALKGDYEQARKYHYEMVGLARAMFIETNPICVKVAMAMMNKIKFSVRLPLCKMTAENEKRLREVLVSAKLI